MDVTLTAVSTTATTVGAAPPTPPTPASVGSVAASSPQTNQSSTSAATAAAQPVASVTPVLGSAKAQNASQTQSGIAPAIAKLFGSGGGAPTPISLNVSYRVDGDFIVTIFTDPKSGQEVAQLPPEILIGLAQFFDQQDGVTLDKSA